MAERPLSPSAPLEVSNEKLLCPLLTGTLLVMEDGSARFDLHLQRLQSRALDLRRSLEMLNPYLPWPTLLVMFRTVSTQLQALFEELYVQSGRCALLPPRCV